MYLIAIDGKEHEGAYSVVSEDGDRILYIFHEQDDATRFAMMLEDDKDFPEMNILEVDGDIIIKTCEMQDYKYSVITSNDIVIPTDNHDFI